MPRVKFITTGHSHMAGNFSNGDTYTGDEAVCRHFVEDARCAVWDEEKVAASEVQAPAKTPNAATAAKPTATRASRKAAADAPAVPAGDAAPAGNGDAAPAGNGDAAPGEAKDH